MVYFQKHHSLAVQDAVRAILLFDLGLRMIYRAIVVVRGTPADARQRLGAYIQTARLLWRTPAAQWALASRAQAAPPEREPALEFRPGKCRCIRRTQQDPTAVRFCESNQSAGFLRTFQVLPQKKTLRGFGV